MSQEEGGFDSLLKAIGDFRQEVVRWIDSHLVSLRECESRHEAEPTPSLPTPDRAARREARPQNESDSREIGGNGSHRRATPFPDVQRVPDARAVNSQGGTPSRKEAADLAEGFSNGDPRHRLDALARQLDERLRGAERTRKVRDRADRTSEQDEIEATSSS
jgi:hypothetical protein